MLLIGDIHITSKWQEPILTMLRERVEANPDEQNIVFLGDYVYHFSYDRKALLALFGFFVDLLKEGKSLYVLAGNHDWIAGHFVYEEARQSFGLLQEIDVELAGHLEFITEPCRREIEGEVCLFFPYYIPPVPERESEKFSPLVESQHKQEHISGRANTLLEQLIEEGKQTYAGRELHVFHHWYVAEVAFPGQFAKFSYKSPALSPHFCQIDGVKMISGHLHKPFTYYNYLCIGSVRSTSPLEINQVKGVFTYRDGQLEMQPVVINPYIRVEVDNLEQVTVLDVDKHLTHIRSEQQNVLKTGDWEVRFSVDPAWEQDRVTLQVVGEGLQYEEVFDKLGADQVHALKDLRIKQSRRGVADMVDQLEHANKQLDASIADWKALLKSYIANKYQGGAERYFEELEELGLGLG